MNVQVRRIDLADNAHEPAIVELLDYLALTPADGQPLPVDVRTCLVPRLREYPGTHVFLAFDSTTPIGLGICFEGFSTFRAARLLNIHDLVVHPDWRGRGVGKRLLEEIQAFAKRHGHCKLTLEVRADGPRRLYLNFGFDFGDPATSAQTFLSKNLTTE